MGALRLVKSGKVTSLRERESLLLKYQEVSLSTLLPTGNDTSSKSGPKHIYVKFLPIFSRNARAP